MKAPFARTFFELLAERTERDPDAIAVICDDVETTYRSLERRARQVAAALRGRGIKRGERIGLLINNRPEWLELCFGASAIGAVVVPFSTFSTRQELDFLIADSGIRMLFTMPRFANQDFAAELSALLEASETASRKQEGGARYPALDEVVLLADGEQTAWNVYSRFADVAPLEALPPPGTSATAADDALIIYTSGSTSYPKAVRLVQHAILENGFNIGERQGLRAGDRVLLAPPLFWSYGGANALPAALTHGATLVLQGKFDAGEAIDLIERHQCTALYTLPGMTKDIVRHERFRSERTRSLRTGLTIGSPQDLIDCAEELGAAEICNIYGSTEGYGNCCVTPHDWPLERRSQCQGPPLPGVEIRITDQETGQSLPAGEVGLIDVHGFVTPGYCGASSVSNATAFTDDGGFRSGDLGYLTGRGDLVFVGRVTEMIKRAGINVSPVEVEEVLLQHDQVALAGVVGVEDPEKQEAIIGFVVPTRGADPAPETLRQHCKDRLSRYKVPDRIVIRDTLPQTATGKLLRRELKGIAETLTDNRTN